MNYQTTVEIGDRLYINCDNPMGSGYSKGDRVLVVGMTCTDDPIVQRYHTIAPKISLHRYCLSFDETLDDEDVELSLRLKRMGI